jgi:amino acid adenylation domain-containing protein
MTSGRIEGFPLSPQQAKLWPLVQADGTRFFTRCAVRLPVGVDTGRLTAAIGRVVKRHEILRTTFAGVPALRTGLQIIHSDPEWTLETGGMELDRASDLPVRWALTDENLLLINASALCADRVAVRNLVAEIAAVYRGAETGADADVLQYADYAQWRNEAAAEQTDPQASEFWVRHSPVSRSEPTTRAPGPGSVDFSFGQDELAAIRSVTGDPAAVLLACWRTVLWGSYPEAGDQAVGVLVDGRNYEQLPEAVGLYEYRVPLRIAVEGRSAFTAIADAAATAISGAAEWQDSCPHVLGAEPSFVYERDTEDGSGSGFVVTRLECRTDAVHLELTVRGEAGQIEYDTEVYSPAEVARLAGRLRSVVRQVAALPGIRVEDIQMCLPQEVDAGWNDTLAAYPSDKCLHQLIEDQVTRTPDATALVFDDGHVTYRELISRADQLSRVLRGMGVKRGSRVGICLPRREDLVVSVLATWKAAAAYVALDPEDASARITGLLHSAQCDVLIAERALTQRLGTLATAVVHPDHTPSTMDQPADLADLTPDDVAYVAHTSGSTGRPNAVVVSHRGVVNYLTYLIAVYALTPDDVVVQQAPFTFDAWIRDCIGPLCAGASVVLGDGSSAEAAVAVLERIEKYSVSRILHTVPTVLRDLADTARDRGFWIDSVRTVLSSGEALHEADCELVRSAFGSGVTVVNQYGPTECTLTSTFWRVPAGGGPIPAGLPIQNVTVHVLNPGGHPVPVGMPGEIHIGGLGVTHGYLGRPDLTADRFRPDPFAVQPGGRLYKSGDIGRRRPDGSIEFAGRRDHQLKIRGVRVEPGEIEATLLAHPTVREAAVVPARLDGGQLSLVAFVAGPGESTAGELRDWLTARLPVSLIPAAFQVVDELPRTPHGKVNRRQLAEEAGTVQSERRVYVAPASGLEQLICEIFAEVLDRAAVSAQDSFFQLGGHSLLGTRVIYELGAALGIRLPLRAIFEFPTAVRLAELVRTEAAGLPHAVAYVTELSTRPAGDILVSRQRPVVADDDQTIPHAGEMPEYPLSYAQQRIWLSDALRPGDPGQNVQAVVRVRGALDVDRLRTVLGQLVSRHPMLRTTFVTSADEPMQIVHPPVAPELTLTDLSAAGAEQDRLLQQHLRDQARQAFDLTRLPLVRCTLVRLTADEHVLVFTMHHIVIDEWSVNVLLRELLACYESLGAGRTPDLPELPLRYVDFAAWQRRWLSGQRLDQLLAHWRERLAGAHFEIELPVDNVPPAAPTGRGHRITTVVPSKLGDAITRLAERHESTRFMVLLAAFKTLLLHHSGQQDLAVGSPIANRTRRELDGVVGFFANILVLRTSLAGDPRFGELLARVRQTALDGYAHQDMPFEKLVEALRPGRTLHRMPLVQIWFVLHNAPAPVLRGTGIELALQDRESDTAKFDLNLALTETDDGLSMAMECSADLFNTTTVRRLLRQYEFLLQAVTEDPDTRLSVLRQRIDEFDQKEREMASGSRDRSASRGFSAFKSAKATPVRVTERELVTIGPLPGAGPLPVLVQPGGSHVELATWVRENRALITRRLHESGGVLFRGFGVHDVDCFQRVVSAYSSHMLDYYERSTPRHAVSGKVYTSTEFPPDRHIPLHNESAYSHFWPRTLWFCCLQPAERGGATPLADSRKILDLLDPALLQRFVERRVMYVRNYHEGFDIPWQDAFQTDDPQVVAQYCQETGMQHEWRDGGVLRTRLVLDPVVSHPDTGEKVWFNQVHAYHFASLDPDTQNALREMFAEDELPRLVRYGDGGKISEDDFAAVRTATEQATVSFPWQQGDALLLDNMLVAHGREPYEGKRKVVVAMSDPYDREQLRANG